MGGIQRSGYHGSQSIVTHRQPGQSEIVCHITQRRNGDADDSLPRSMIRRRPAIARLRRLSPSTALGWMWHDTGKWHAGHPDFLPTTVQATQPGAWGSACLCPGLARRRTKAGDTRRPPPTCVVYIRGQGVNINTAVVLSTSCLPHRASVCILAALPPDAS